MTKGKEISDYLNFEILNYSKYYNRVKSDK